VSYGGCSHAARADLPIQHLAVALGREKFTTLALEKPGAWQFASAAGTLWLSHLQKGWFTLTDNAETLTLTLFNRPVVCPAQQRPHDLSLRRRAMDFRRTGPGPGQRALGFGGREGSLQNVPAAAGGMAVPIGLGEDALRLEAGLQFVNAKNFSVQLGFKSLLADRIRVNSANLDLKFPF